MEMEEIRKVLDSYNNETNNTVVIVNQLNGFRFLDVEKNAYVSKEAIEELIGEKLNIERTIGLTYKRRA